MTSQQSDTHGAELVEITITTETDNASEYDRFADLAGKLVQVPKTEIDAERAKGSPA